MCYETFSVTANPESLGYLSSARIERVRFGFIAPCASNINTSDNKSSLKDLVSQVDPISDLLCQLRDIAYWKRRDDQDWLHNVPPGLLTSAMNRACLAAFQASQGQRLMLAVYDVELQVPVGIHCSFIFVHQLLFNSESV